MKGIIDIHAHILPGIDDGSSSMEETLQMLRLAAEEGIADIIATPHASERFPSPAPGKIRELVRRVQEEAARSGSGVRIFPGQEILYTEETAERLRRGELLTLGGSRYVLLEFYPGTLYIAICRAVEELLQKGYIPVLAHIERYEGLRAEGRIEALRKRGAYMQMNFQSAIGSAFSKSVRYCRGLLKEEKIDFLGTDMHNIRERRPRAQKTVYWLKGRVPELYLARLLRENPGSILADKKLT